MKKGSHSANSVGLESLQTKLKANAKSVLKILLAWEGLNLALLVLQRNTASLDNLHVNSAMEDISMTAMIASLVMLVSLLRKVLEILQAACLEKMQHFQMPALSIAYNALSTKRRLMILQAAIARILLFERKLTN